MVKPSSDKHGFGTIELIPICIRVKEILNILYHENFVKVIKV